MVRPQERVARRRGRPTNAEAAERRTSALAAALKVLTDTGYDRMTMSAVAAEAGCSKESLYAWFESKEHLLATLIRDQAAATTSAVEAALERSRRGDAEADLESTRKFLAQMGFGLLSLLTSPTSLALNRAAMTSPGLAQTLLAHGRYTTGPLLEDYFRQLDQAGLVSIEDAGEAFTVFYGLVIRDFQIRALLGEAPLDEAERRQAAEVAADSFLTLYRFGAPREGEAK